MCAVKLKFRTRPNTFPIRRLSRRLLWASWRFLW